MSLTAHDQRRGRFRDLCEYVQRHLTAAERPDIEELQRLPGIGPKGAQRLAFHILKTPREQVDRLTEAISEVKDRVTYCSVCNNITDANPCFFCTSDSRDPRIICVVEEPENVGGILPPGLKLPGM